jgi:hypothetical protein
MHATYVIAPVSISNEEAIARAVRYRVAKLLGLPCDPLDTACGVRARVAKALLLAA